MHKLLSSSWLRRPSRLLAAVAVAAAIAVPASSASAAPATCGGSGSVTTVNGGLADNATYEIQCPAGSWNGTLFLYSHGYVAPGASNPPQDVGDPITGAWLLAHGYALAGSSYATTGWSIEQALPDQISTLDVFQAQYGKPAQTIAWGHSLGGIITAGLIQRYPDRFTAALPMCGVLSGGVATWNTALDAAFAFQQLVAPNTGLQVVNITNPVGNLIAAESAAAAAQATPAGRARIALAAALGDTPGWFSPLSAEPASTDYAGQEANQYLWDSQVDFPFIFDFRANLEQVAGGNPSWTTGVNFTTQLSKSADYQEVVSLYQAAGLNLQQDLRTLNQATQITANPQSVDYLAHNISFNGEINIPVLTMHTTGDGLVVPQNEQAYAQAVHRAGNTRLLRQAFVSRAGHCAFTPAETIAAVQVLLDRISTGHWNDAALTPAGLNTAAAALGPQFNVFAAQGGKCPVGSPVSGLCAVSPAYVSYQPTSYLRPFDLGRQR
ncbi:MAG TPA: prolyl oligopeptidase family serine peptidase [Streptosporangiaceae bacterium]|nr:prolyl oligopeptidase family serine peptidase [Streptosporangiaceae bacterium]